MPGIEWCEEEKSSWNFFRHVCRWVLISEEWLESFKSDPNTFQLRNYNNLTHIFFYFVFLLIASSWCFKKLTVKCSFKRCMIVMNFLIPSFVILTCYLTSQWVYFFSRPPRCFVCNMNNNRSKQSWRKSLIWAVETLILEEWTLFSWPVDQQVAFVRGPLTPRQIGTSYLWTMINRTGPSQSGLFYAVA